MAKNRSTRAAGTFDVCLVTWLQQRTPPARLGRVMSLVELAEPPARAPGGDRRGLPSGAGHVGRCGRMMDARRALAYPAAREVAPMTQPYRPDPSDAARRAHRQAADQAAAAHAAAMRAHQAHVDSAARAAQGGRLQSNRGRRSSGGAGGVLKGLVGLVAVLVLGFIGLTALAGADVDWAVQVMSWFEGLG